MHAQRRIFLKWLGGLGGVFFGANRSLSAAPQRHRQRRLLKPLMGVNAYYLLVESYRKVAANGRRKIAQTVMQYLTDDLRLFALRDKCCLNTLRFWSFNDYPAPYKDILPGAFDGRLWLSADAPNALAFDVLEALVTALKQTELFLIPVLGNYWMAYGGILQYLVWAGELPARDYRSALNQNRQVHAKLYLQNTRRFYTSPAVEQCFRAHCASVLKRLARNPNVVIIDILNEPRGKTSLSLANRPDENALSMSDVVARWIHRQAVWARRQWAKYSQRPLLLSSGEEGWSESPAPFETRALKRESQFYEGIDLRKNLLSSPKGVDIGSVHLYTHRVVKKRRADVFGCLYTDRRGWGHLLRTGLPRTRRNYQLLAREWILSRSMLLGDAPWYIGEMGWCWPADNADLRPLSANNLQRERIALYRRWTALALENGALGTCVWMLNGCQHKDHFYGLSLSQLAEILGHSPPA